MNTINSIRAWMAAAALLLGASGAAQAQQTQQICSHQTIPPGWVHVDTQTTALCRSPGNNAINLPNGTLTIRNVTQELSDVKICADQDVLPDQWMWISSVSDPYTCAQAVGSSGTSPRYFNARWIRNVSRLTGNVGVCSSQAINMTDWQVTQTTSVYNCQFPSVSNTATGSPNNYTWLQRRCTLGTSSTYVGAGQAYSYVVSQGQSNIAIPYGSHGRFHGTKNGVVDTAPGGFDFGVVPTTMNYTNQNGWEGAYTRYVEVVTPQGVQHCRTNTIDQTLAYTPPPPPVCTLQVSSATVGPNQPYAFYATVQGTLPTGSQAYWYGTNGNTPVTPVLAGTIPQTFSYTNQPGWAGSYTRQLIVFNGQTEVCRTGTVSVVLQ